MCGIEQWMPISLAVLVVWICGSMVGFVAAALVLEKKYESKIMAIRAGESTDMRHTTE